ncbi:toxin-antitoxin system YwqK family antitoxin [Balneola sp. MJW-20]|uniref:toxin-antitoxin system YwqK family antitoxin n=1 Tax=Gracilimonas aurantiaca TaxID=3234185 RepID=UPI003465F5B1
MIRSISTILLLSALFCASCKNYSEDVVDLRQLKQFEGVVYSDSANVPFTGIVVDSVGDTRILYAEYQNGLRNGYAEAWYANGHTKYLGDYYDGKKIGEWKNYYSNGQLKDIGFIGIDGMNIGTSRHYDREGNLTDIRIY